MPTNREKEMMVVQSQFDALRKGYLAKRGIEGEFTPLNHFEPIRDRIYRKETNPVCMHKDRITRAIRIIGYAKVSEITNELFCGYFTEEDQVSPFATCQMLGEALLGILRVLDNLPKDQREGYYERMTDVYLARRNGEQVCKENVLHYVSILGTALTEYVPEDCRKKALRCKPGRPKKKQDKVA